MKIKLITHIAILLTLIIGSGYSSAKTTLALLGDSMTWIGGDSCDKERGWTYHFKSAADSLFRIDMYARSGATWTNTSTTKGDPQAYSAKLDDENVIFAQVLRLIGASKNDSEKCPDIILIYAGANDAWFASKRPGIFNDSIKFTGNTQPAACTSLSSSIDLCVSMLREAFPMARIVLMTPIEMSKTSAERINQVGDIIERCGDKAGIEVLRADRHVPIRHLVEKKKFTYTTDGVHSNPAGAKLIADYIFTSLFTK